MGFFKPQTARRLAEFLAELCERWDKSADREGLINPDEPVVLRVPNPEFEGPSEDDGWIDEEGNPKYDYCHVMSIGGGADIDENGDECGHSGAEIGGMEIDKDVFLYNGRRMEPK